MQNKSKIKIVIFSIVATVVAIFSVFGVKKSSGFDGGAGEVLPESTPSTDVIQEVLIEGNTFSGGYTYFHVEGGTSVTLKDCKLESSKSNAIIVDGGTLNVVDTTISEFVSSGIVINGGTVNLIGDTNIYGGLSAIDIGGGSSCGQTLNIGTPSEDFTGNIWGTDHGVSALNGSVVNMYSGTIGYYVDDNVYYDGCSVSAMLIQDSLFNMYGGKIDQVWTTECVELNDWAIFNMSGGEIACAGTSAVCMSNESTFNLSGTGVLQTPKESYVVDDGTCSFNMNGGTILGNGEESGSFFDVENFSMTGGLISGSVNDNGGLFKVKYGETLSLTGGTIQNCSATNGGAIYVASGGTLELGDVTIENCSATNGGAIYNAGTVRSASVGGTTKILNCSASEGNGGGIYNASTGTINLTTSGLHINNCDVFNGAGGGIYNDYDLQLPVNTIIENCDVSVDAGVTVEPHTQVVGTGGAIYSSNKKNLTLSGNATTKIKIDNCTAVCGGAISNKTSMSLSYVDITNCSATLTGGSIYTDYTAQAQLLSNVKITGSSLPSGKTAGVVIRVRGASKNFTPYTLTNCNFDNNDVITASANAIYMQYVNMTMNSSTMQNIADGSGNDKTIGIAIAASSSDVTLGGGTIISGYGSTSSTGGAISATIGSRLYIYDATLSNNTANNGGAIYVAKRATHENLKDNGEFRRSSVTLSSGANITGNKATNGGGIYAGDSAKAYINSGANITTNTATTSGGGIYASSAILEVSGNVSSNTTGKTGGGLYLLNCETVSLNGSKINANNAQNGGGIYASGTAISDLMVETVISNNTATNNGGGVYIQNNSSMSMNHVNAIIQGNYSTRGAGVYVSTATFELKNGSIRTNGTVEGDLKTTMGAGIYATGTTTINISGGEITGGNTTGSGCGIHAVGSTTVTMTGGTISNNVSGGGGGGILISGTSELRMSGGYVTGNSASQAGGITFSGIGAKGYLSGGTISGNIANAYIAGIGMTGSYVELSGDIKIIENYVQTDSTLTNTSSGHAAGISVDQASTGEPGTLIMDGGLIADNYVVDANSVEGHGGGIFINRGSDFEMNGGIIRNNNVSAGGNSSGAQIFVTQDVDESNTTSFTMNGGMIIGDGSQALYGGILVSMGELNLLGGEIIANNSKGSDIIVGNNVTLGGDVEINATIALLKNDVFAYSAGANLDGEEIGYTETTCSTIAIESDLTGASKFKVSFFDGQYDMYNKRFHVGGIDNDDAIQGYNPNIKDFVTHYFENQNYFAEALGGVSVIGQEKFVSDNYEIMEQDRKLYIRPGMFDYELSGDEDYYIVSLNDSWKDYDGEISIPSSYNNLPVREIAIRGFADSAITIVHIPENIQEIKSSAFINCRNLSRIDFSEGLTAVYHFAFENCPKLEVLEFPSTVVTYGRQLFANSGDNLKVYLRYNEGMDFSATTFYGSKATTQIYTNIESADVISDNTWCMYDVDIVNGEEQRKYLDVVYNVSPLTMYNPDFLIRPDGTLVYYYGFDEVVEIPYGVTEIGRNSRASVDYLEGVFEDNYALREIIIPDSVKSIHSHTFSGCLYLTDVALPADLESIEAYTFWNCEELGQIKIPESVCYIDEYAFYGCSSIESIEIPNCVASGAFAYCSRLKNVVMRKGSGYYAETTIIGYNDPDVMGAFEHCEQLERINIPTSGVEIGYEAFAGCSMLSEINWIHPNYCEIYPLAFSGCLNLEYLFIPYSSVLCDYVFNGCEKLNLVVDKYESNLKTTPWLGSTEISLGYWAQNWKYDQGTLDQSFVSVTWKDGNPFLDDNYEDSIIVDLYNNGVLYKNNYTYSLVYGSQLPQLSKDGYVFEGWCLYQVAGMGVGHAFTQFDFPDSIFVMDKVFYYERCNCSHGIYDYVSSDGVHYYCSGISENQIFAASQDLNYDDNDDLIVDYMLPFDGQELSLYASFRPVRYFVTIYDYYTGAQVYNKVLNYGQDVTFAADYGHKPQYINKSSGVTYDSVQDAMRHHSDGEHIELYRKMTPERYFINFDFGDDTPIVSGWYGFGEKIPVFSKTGYYTTRWDIGNNYAIDENGYLTTDLGSDGAEVTLHSPTWVAEKYQITFDLNGGYLYGSNPRDMDYGTALPTPTRAGYTFGGWYSSESSDNGTGTKYEAVPDFGDDGASVTLYALWTIETYNVTFYDDDDSTVLRTQQLQYGESLSPITRTGYVFEGWADTTYYDHTIYDVCPDFGVNGADGSLYAIWQIKSYYITFNSNGGNAVASAYYDYNSSLPTTGQMGYTFNGWCINSDCSDSPFKTVPNFGDNGASVTLYASWTIETYNVTFYDDDDSTVLRTQQLQYGESLSPITRTGYVFEGWADTTYYDHTIYDVCPDFGVNGADGSLYAIWQIKSYYITFNSNGGNAVASAYYDYNSSLPTTSKTGYTFNGWCRNSSLSDTEYKTTQDYGNNGTSLTLYASWTIETYNITYYDEDNSTVLKSSNVSYGSALWTPTKTGYTFDCWKDSIYSDPSTYNGGAACPDFGANGTSVDLYAWWTINRSVVKPGALSNVSSISYSTSQNGTYIVLPSSGVTLSANTTYYFRANLASKDGYTTTFTGFSGAFTGTANPTAFSFTSNGQTYTINASATQTINSYTITFNLDGGSLSGGSVQTLEYGTTLPTPTKTGYYFSDWVSGSEAFSTVPDLGNNGASGSFTATWGLELYNISFNENGGSSVTDKSYAYNTSLPTTSKTGYTFNGWCRNSSLNDTAYKTTQDYGNNGTSVTLYASWTIETYNITYYDEDNSTVLKSSGVSYGSALWTPTKTGYTFDCWKDSIYSDPLTYNGGSACPDFGSNGASVSLYAWWDQEYYTVTLDTNGGTITSGANPRTMYHGYAMNNVSITRTGYTFNGWYSTETNGNGSGTKYITCPDLGENGATATFYASWTIESYNITYYDDDNSTVLKNSGVSYGSALWIPTKTGFTFDCWVDSIYSSPGEYQGGAACPDFGNNGASVNLYAWWTINRSVVKPGALSNVSSISYSTSQNGTYIVLPSSGVTLNANTTYYFRANLASKEGYTTTFTGFSGAFTGSANPTAFSFTSNGQTYTINASATQTINSYTITFNLDGGSLSGGSVQTLEYGQALPTPTKTGYYFDGWIAGSDYHYTVTGTGTYTASWIRESYNITFNENGGSSVTDKSYAYNTSLPTTSKAGYTFNGWCKNSNLSDTAYKTTQDYGNNGASVTLYASWTIETYNVTFYDDDDSTVLRTQQLQYGESLSPITRTGYVFEGWADTTYYDHTIYAVCPDFGVNGADGSLYAIWQIKSYYITFNSNGGNAVASAYYDYNSSLPTPTRMGYTFNGWCKNSNLSDTAYKTTQDYGNNGTSVTLYASWTINTYTITFKDGGSNTLMTQTIAYGGALPTYTYGGWYYTTWYDSLHSDPNEYTHVDGNYVNNGCPSELYLGGSVAATYIVTFDTNGGTLSGSNPRSMTYLQSLSSVVPTKSGYKFDGWYSSESSNNGTGTKYTSVPNCGNQGSSKTLYAKWVAAATYTLTVQCAIDWEYPSYAYSVLENTVVTIRSDESDIGYVSFVDASGQSHEFMIAGEHSPCEIYVDNSTLGMTYYEDPWTRTITITKNTTISVSEL